MKRYRVIGGEQLEADTYVAQFLATEDGDFVATIEQIIKALNDSDLIRIQAIELRKIYRDLKALFDDPTMMDVDDEPVRRLGRIISGE